jgi:hypothetical protein
MGNAGIGKAVIEQLATSLPGTVSVAALLWYD